MSETKAERWIVRASRLIDEDSGGRVNILREQKGADVWWNLRDKELRLIAQWRTGGARVFCEGYLAAMKVRVLSGKPVISWQFAGGFASRCFGQGARG
jgi:hypothetical protein